MSFEMKQGRYVARIFYVEFREHEGNLLAFMYQDPDKPEVWQIDYRFRWYLDDKMGRDSKDVRSWWHIDSKDEKRVALEKFKTVLMVASALRGERIAEVEVESDNVDVFLTVLGAQPWTSRTVEPEPN